MIWDSRGKNYLDHLDEDNVCSVCEGHFDSLGNLEHVGGLSICTVYMLMIYNKHKISHMERHIECYGCYRMFKTFPHMILHLENGGCESDITTQDLYMTATQCYQAHKYTDRNYQIDMLNGEDLEELYADTVFPFQCPECDGDFSTLSGLLQHASSQTCEQTLQAGAIGKLVKWLDKQYR